MKKILFLIINSFVYQIDPILEYIDKETYDIIEPNQINLKKKDLIDSYACAVSVHSVLKSVSDIFEDFKSAGKPTILIQDGIVEYRHLLATRQKSLKNPITHVPRYMPIYSDYFFAFSNISKKILNNLGFDNEKILITGCARFDNIFSNFSKSRRAKRFLGKINKIGIATSNTPGYSDEENIKTCELILKLYSNLTDLNFKSNDISFRIGKGFTNWIERYIYECEFKDKPLLSSIKCLKEIIYSASNPEQNLQDFLNDCTILFTTPSTISLEAMATGIPVVHLIINEEPVIQKSLWSLGVNSDIRDFYDSLFKRDFITNSMQEVILEDSILTIDNASPLIAKNILQISNKEIT